jgi:hypothetical protein
MEAPVFRNGPGLIRHPSDQNNVESKKLGPTLGVARDIGAAEAAIGIVSDCL